MSTLRARVVGVVNDVILFSGELLLDQQLFQDAVEKFDRAIELERLKCFQNMMACYLY